eukprot:Gregarina_sp_Pseudo_9__1782@NODE_2211_length_1095_cov_10_051136_g2036_i0_p1_GENE_NODE_2211_length_1095_cov_10_051136_g2036_i0NODE_2211_length_1095_cov_10_051136_g2036_i0_p1_ORF_typecomplete_len210_score15_66Flavoprotein/PF02441_19/4_3e35_NODE_2211_length_1095_cov_10_051136_g2036_i04661095
MGMVNILILASGSIAVKKISKIWDYVESNYEEARIKIVASKAAKELAIVYAESPADKLFAEEWQTEEDISQANCEHIQLMKWADLCVVLPLTANTMSKVACGCCDNFLLSILRAWPFDENHKIEKPIMAFPAMNTNMWIHPITMEVITKLQGWGWTICSPIAKKLACGDYGIGALPEYQDVGEAILSMVRQHFALAENVCLCSETRTKS